MNDTLILGIETSCDETAAAVVKNGKEVLSGVVSSQVELHSRYGGVVPEIASRHHLENINFIIDEAIEGAAIKPEDLTAVAVTSGPGLIGALLIGFTTAKAISYTLGVPLLGVNHLEGHIHANFLSYPELEPPLVTLLVSGGHTSLILCREDGSYETLGETLDDAAGEAYDKVAKCLGLGYPGGPVIDRLSKEGDPSAIDFPRAMRDRKTDFSFSGIKTAVLTYVRKNPAYNPADLAASFQEAVVDMLVEKTVACCLANDVESVALGGGVAANSRLREVIKEQAGAAGLKCYLPDVRLCTDNAVMIASAAFQHYRNGEFLGLSDSPAANLPL